MYVYCYGFFMNSDNKADSIEITLHLLKLWNMGENRACSYLHIQPTLIKTNKKI